jgi:hypothetical protein
VRTAREAGVRAPLNASGCTRPAFLRAERFDRAALPRRWTTGRVQSSANGFCNEVLGGAVLRVVRIMSMKARNAAGT